MMGGGGGVALDGRWLVVEMNKEGAKQSSKRGVCQAGQGKGLGFWVLIFDLFFCFSFVILVLIYSFSLFLVFPLIC